jgi:hypothetical protein
VAESAVNRRARTLGRASLAVGLAPLVVAVAFTLATGGAVLSGNAAFLEDSRLLNRAYLQLSLAGEVIALGGLIIGTAALAAGRKLSSLIVAGLALNGVMALLFLPATLAFVFNGFFALLEQLSG